MNDFLTERFSENVRNFVHFFFREFTSSATQVDLGDFAGENRESSSDTLDTTEGEADLMLAVNVCVHHTEKVLELGCAR